MTDPEKIDVPLYAANVSLRDYFDSRLQAIEDVIKRDREVSGEALKQFKDTNDAHLKLLNGETERTKQRELEFVAKEKEFAKSDSVRLQFASLEEKLSIQIEGLKESIGLLEKQAEFLRGRASMKSVIVAYVISGISLLIGIIKLFE